MPQSNKPQGFQPIGYADGSSWNGQANTYVIPQADVNQYNIGDAVLSAAGGDANGVPAVTKASGSSPVRGVIVGVYPTNPNAPSLQGVDTSLAMQNIPATKTRDYYVMVADDPAIIFALQDDGVSTLTASACNKNAGYTVANPTAPAQNSATVLTTSSVATTASLPLKIMGLQQIPGNAFGKYAVWRIKFNQHELAGNTAGV